MVDSPRWPPEAVRELIGNALIHRDLAPRALGETAMLRLDHERLVVRNPGGLYGLTIDRLGQTGVTSARNAHLVRICHYVRLPDGTRAVEALASGIPTVFDALTAAALPRPLFDDDGLRFTAIVRHTPAAKPNAVRAGSSSARVLAALAAGPADVEQLAQTTGLSPANIRKRPRELRANGLVEQRGGPGRATTYARVERWAGSGTLSSPPSPPRISHQTSNQPADTRWAQPHPPDRTTREVPARPGRRLTVTVGLVARCDAHRLTVVQARYGPFMT